MRLLPALLVLVLITASMIVQSPVYCSTTDFELVDAYWSPTLTLGTNNTLIVKLRYVGTGTVSNIAAQLTIRNVAGTDLTDTASYPWSLDPGTVLTLEFEFDVPEDAKASYYPATLSLSYLVDSSPKTLDISFDVGFLGSPRFTVEADKTTLPAGSRSSLKLTVYVQDAPARQVQVRVAPASPFVTVIGGNVYTAGIADVGTAIEVPLEVIIDSSASDSVSLTVTVSYEDFSQTPGSETVTVGFRVSRRPGPHIAASLVPSRVVSGRVSTVKVYVTNKGSGSARDVHASLSPASPGVAVVAGSSASLGDLAPGSTASFTAKVRVDRTVTGTATLTLTVTYYDDASDTHIDTLTLGLEVSRGPLPIITVEALNTSLPRGREANVTLRVSNIGDGTAELLVVEVVSGRGVLAIGNSRALVNELSPGHAVNVTFKVVASPPMGSLGAIADFKLRYYDDSGSEYTDTLSLSFRVTDPEKPALSVMSLNRTLYSNQVNRVVIRLVNTGAGTAFNVTFTLTSQSAELGSVIGPSLHRLARLEPNSSVDLEYEVFVQPKVYGALQLVAAIDYEDELGNKYRRLLTVGYKVVGDWDVSVVHVATMPPVVFPGDSMVRLMVTVANTGDYMARNVELRLLEGYWIKPSTAAGTRALLPYLPVGQTATLTFFVDVDEKTPPGNHELVLDASGKRVKLLLTVLEKARFDVRNVTSTIFQRSSRGNRLVVEIENVSHSEAKDVRVELYSPFLTGSTSTYVGTVAPGEKRLLSFEFDVDPATPVGPLQVEVKIRWNQERRELTQYSHITLVIVEKRLPWEAITAITVLALILAAILVYSRKEKLAASARHTLTRLKRLTRLPSISFRPKRKH